MSSTKPDVEIEIINEADIDAAVVTIQDAFYGDPFASWVYDFSKFSKVRNNASLDVRMRWGIRNGKIFVAHTPERRCAGIAMWVAPREAAKPQTWGEWLEEWRLWFDQVKMNVTYGRGGLNVKRYYIWKDAQAAMQNKLWTDPDGYWFLNILAIHPDSQGKGIGKALHEVVAKQADVEGRACYLESSKFDPNVKIYEKLGYRLLEEMDCVDPADGRKCKLFSMIRDPKPSSKTNYGSI